MTGGGALRARDGSMVRLLRASGVVGGALALVASLAIVLDGHGAELLSELIVVFLFFAVFFAVVVWLVTPQQARNPVVWTMAASALFSGVYLGGVAAASRLVDDPGLILMGAEQLAPSDLPRSAVLVLLMAEPGLALGLFPLLTFGFLLFPDGRLPSPGWRWVGWFAGSSITAATVFYAWGFRPWASTPPDETVLVTVGFGSVTLSVLMCLAGLLVRYRQTTGDSRQQFRWVVWGASVFGTVMVAAVSLGGSRYESWIHAPFLIATAAFLISYGVAVGKYRLYDIDIIITKSFTYLGMAAVIALLYAVIVVGPLLIIGLPDEGGPGLALPILATVLVAVVFEPVRSRMQRWANRLVYGSRATPYEVLSQVTARLGESSDSDRTAELAELLARGTGAEQATVWLRIGETLVAEGVWPADVSHNPIAEDGLPQSELARSSPVRHGA